MGQIAAFLIRFRLVVFGLLVVLTGLFVPGIFQLDFAYRVESFLRTDDPELQKDIDHYDNFPDPENMLIFGFEVADPLSDESLDALEVISQRLAALPDVERVVDLATLPDPRLQDRKRLREFLPKSRLYRRLFHSMPSPGHEGALGGIALVSFGDLDNTERARMLAQVRAVGKGIPRADGSTFDVDLVCGGIPVLRQNYVDMIKHDQRVFLPLCAGLSFLLLLYLVPGLGLALASVMIVPLTLIWTFGLLGYLGSSLSLLTSTLPTLLMVISVADAVHLVLRYKHDRIAHKGRLEASELALRRTFYPCALTSLTTIIGFGSLMLAGVPDLRDLGFMASVGILVAFLLTVLALPATIPLLGRLAGEGSDHAKGALFFGRLSERLGHLPPGRILLGFALLTALALSLGMNVKQNSYVMEDLFPDSEPARTYAWFEEHFSGTLTGELVVEPKKGALLDDGAVAELDAFVQWAEEQPGILRTLSYVDALKDGVPRALLPMIGRPPFAFFSADGRKARVLVFNEDFGAIAAEKWFARIQEKAASLEHITIRPTGLQIFATRQVTLLIEEVKLSFFFAFLLITLIMALSFRSLKYGLLAMIPNVFPMLITIGYMGAVGMNLRIVSVISFAIAFGLAVDNTIHILARFQHERREGHCTDIAVTRSLAAVGGAVWTTSLLLLLGFGVLQLSSFKASHEFGVLACVTILSALAGDLLFLPALLRIAGRREERRAALLEDGPARKDV